MKAIEEKTNRAINDNDLDRRIPISIVREHNGGCRCVYIGNRRIWGGKPYASERLPHYHSTTTIRDVLDAFTVEILVEAIDDRRKRSKVI